MTPSAAPRTRAALAALLALPLLILSAPLVRAQTTAFEVKDASSDTLLYLDTAAGFVVKGTFDSSLLTAMPATGAGDRMMWYPAFAAFRAGGIVGGTPRIPGEADTGTWLWDQDFVGWYSTAFGLDTQARGDYSFAAGKASFASGDAAFAMGEGTTATGTSSVALGYRAHTNSRPGAFVFADRSSDDAFRSQVNNSASWRVSGGFRIYTTSAAGNDNPGVTIQSGLTTSNYGQANAVISTSTGAYLHTNGTWTNSSDRRRKHAVERIDGEGVLDRLGRLPISTWTYNVEPEGVRHMGPMAQDFYAAFGLGQDSTAISTVDADGVALAGVQALEARTRAQEARIAALEAELVALRDERPGPFQAALTPLGVLAVLGLAGAFVRQRRAGDASNPS